MSKEAIPMAEEVLQDLGRDVQDYYNILAAIEDYDSLTLTRIINELRTSGSDEKFAVGEMLRRALVARAHMT